MYQTPFTNTNLITMVVDLEYLAKRIQQKRGENSLRAAGEESGISFNTIRGLETGIRTPDLSTYFKVCDWIGVPLEHFRLPQN